MPSDQLASRQSRAASARTFASAALGGREAYPLLEAEGAAVLWRATLRPKGSDAEIEIDGMDLALVEGDRLSRNDVYFDRAAFAPLLAGVS